MKAAMDVAVNRGYAKERIEPLTNNLDFDKIKDVGKLKIVGRARTMIPLPAGPDPTDANTIYFFTISYEADVKTFPIEKYEKDFEKVVQDARLYGHARFAVRGHADITLTLRHFVKAAMETKECRKQGEKRRRIPVFPGQGGQGTGPDRHQESPPADQHDGLRPVWTIIPRRPWMPPRSSPTIARWASGRHH